MQIEIKYILNELRLMRSLLIRTRELFSSREYLHSSHYKRLVTALARISTLSSEIFGSSDCYEAWVGNLIYRTEENDKDEVKVSGGHIGVIDRAEAFIEGILENEQREIKFESLQNEMIFLKEQLSEVRQRENTYFQVVEKLPNSLDTSFILERRVSLLDSLRREQTIVQGNLNYLNERRALYGLNVPIDIMNQIQYAEKEMERITTKIASTESQKS